MESALQLMKVRLWGLWARVVVGAGGHIASLHELLGSSHLRHSRALHARSFLIFVAHDGSECFCGLVVWDAFGQGFQDAVQAFDLSGVRLVCATDREEPTGHSNDYAAYHAGYNADD